MTRKNEKRVENVLTIPITLIPFVVTSLLTIGVVFAAVKSAYSQADGKVLEERVANIEKKVDIILQHMINENK